MESSGKRGNLLGRGIVGRGIGMERHVKLNYMRERILIVPRGKDVDRTRVGKELFQVRFPPRRAGTGHQLKLKKAIQSTREGHICTVRKLC